MGIKGPFEVTVHHAGLHNHQPVLYSDLEDLVHPQHVEDDAALFRHGHAAQTCAGPAWDDWDLIFVGQLDNCRDLLSVLRPHRYVGPVFVFRGIVGVGDQIDEAVREVFLTEDVDEPFFDYLVHGELLLTFCLNSNDY